MNKIKKSLIVCGVILFIVLIAVVFYLLGGYFTQSGKYDNSQQTDSNANKQADINNSTNDDNNKDKTQPVEIELSMSNYLEYFDLQEEMLSYNQTEYIKNNVTFTKANQTTKISIIMLKENLKFNNVKLTIENNTKTGAVYVSSGAPVYRWSGNGGILNLAYDGSGYLTLYATYDNVSSELMYCRNVKYKISKVEGSISTNNQ